MIDAKKPYQSEILCQINTIKKYYKKILTYDIEKRNVASTQPKILTGMIMNKHIKRAIQFKPKTIINDVRMTDSIDMGSPVLEIQKRGHPHCDYVTVHELERDGKPAFVSEGTVYTNIYFCAPGVPANVVEILSVRGAA